MLFQFNLYKSEPGRNDWPQPLDHRAIRARDNSLWSVTACGHFIHLALPKLPPIIKVDRSALSNSIQSTYMIYYNIHVHVF